MSNEISVTKVEQIILKLPEESVQFNTLTERIEDIKLTFSQARQVMEQIAYELGYVVTLKKA